MNEEQDTKAVVKPPERVFGTMFLVTGIGIWFNPLLASTINFVIAVLYWWRIDRKRKAIIHLVIGGLVINLFTFFSSGSILFWTKDKWGLWLSIIQIALAVLVSIYLGIASDIDGKKYDGRAGPIVRTPWWTGMLLAVLLLAVFITSRIGFDAGARMLGACGLPSMGDLIADQIESQRDGIAQILLKRDDLGCGWNVFVMGTTYLVENVDGALAKASGGLTAGDYGPDGQLVTFYEAVWEYETLNSPIYPDVTYFPADVSGMRPIFFDLDLEPSARFKSAVCYAGDRYSVCRIALAYTHIGYRLKIESTGSVDVLVEIVRDILPAISERVREMDASLP